MVTNGCGPGSQIAPQSATQRAEQELVKWQINCVQYLGIFGKLICNSQWQASTPVTWPHGLTMASGWYSLGLAVAMVTALPDSFRPGLRGTLVSGWRDNEEFACHTWMGSRKESNRLPTGGGPGPTLIQAGVITALFRPQFSSTTKTSDNDNIWSEWLSSSMDSLDLSWHLRVLIYSVYVCILV